MTWTSQDVDKSWRRQLMTSTTLDGHFLWLPKTSKAKMMGIGQSREQKGHHYSSALEWSTWSTLLCTWKIYPLNESHQLFSRERSDLSLSMIPHGTWTIYPLHVNDLPLARERFSHRTCTKTSPYQTWKNRRNAPPSWLFYSFTDHFYDSSFT